MAADREYILAHFEEAVRQGRILAFYQPTFRTLSERVCGAEALARWVDEDGGMLSPMDFIPVLEEEGLIFRLDMTILLRACTLYADLVKKGLEPPPFSVNLSRLSFEREELFEEALSILERCSVPRSAVHFEITESAMISDPDRFKKVFDRFHDAGFKIWIDDFGSGYSSLNVLQNYEFDLLKLDMMFLRTPGIRTRRIISSIINMAKTMGIHTLIEGAETQDQVAFIKNTGCEIIQGYYYSRPLSEADYVRILTKEPERVESRADYAYWQRIGHFNFLSPKPLEEAGEAFEEQRQRECLCQSDIPLGLMETGPDRHRFIYANQAYMERVLEFGFAFLEELEDFFNDRESGRSRMLGKLFARAVSEGGVQEVDHVFGDMIYHFICRALAKNKEKQMMAVTIRIFSQREDLRLLGEPDFCSRSMFTTYEYVEILYPDRDAYECLYSSEDFSRLREADSLRAANEEFCRRLVIDEDQERYRRSFDMDTLGERLAKSGKRFLQEAFRIRSGSGSYLWRAIRITEVPGKGQRSYLYTLQDLSPGDASLADLIIHNHPGALLDRP